MFHHLKIAVGLVRGDGVRQQARFQGRRSKGFEVEPAAFGVGVLAGDHLALFGQP